MPCAASNERFLYTASKDGNLEKVTKQLTSGTNPNTKPCLHAAKTMDIARVLLQHFANPDLGDKRGQTPVHIAAKNNRPKRIQLLASFMANLEAVDKEGKVPLHLAVEAGHPKVVALLLSLGVNVQARDDNGETPLHFAVKRRNVVILNLLLHHNSNVGVKDKEGKTPLHGAVLIGNAVVLKSLLNGITRSDESSRRVIDSVDTQGKTPLHYSAGFGDYRSMGLLLDQGAEITIADSEGKTPLHHNVAQQPKNSTLVLDPNEKKKASFNFLAKKAAKKQLENPITYMWRLLFNAEDFSSSSRGTTKAIAKTIKARVMATDKNGKIALHIASAHGREDLIEQLLGQGISEHILNQVLCSPRSAMVSMKRGRGSVDVHHLVRELSSLRFAVDNVDNRMMASLHHAAEHGHTSVMLLLMKNGAIINKTDSWQMTPLHHASKRGNEDGVGVLLKSLGDVHRRFSTWEFSPLRSTLNAVDRVGMTSLHHASEHGHIGVVKLLLKYGATASKPNFWQMTPLHFGSKGGHKDVVELLLNACGDKAYGVDAKGMTELHYASRFGYWGVVDLLLLHAGAQVLDDVLNVRDPDGMTPLLYAAKHGKFGALEQLFHRGAKAFLDENGGDNPILLAAQGQGSDDESFEIVEFLLKNGEGAESALSDKGFPLQTVQKRKINLNPLDKNMMIPLHHAAQKGKARVVKLLLNSGANLDAVDKNNNSVLYYAALSGELDIVSELLKRDAFVTVLQHPKEKRHNPNGGFSPSSRRHKRQAF